MDTRPAREDMRFRSRVIRSRTDAGRRQKERRRKNKIAESERRNYRATTHRARIIKRKREEGKKKKTIHSPVRVRSEGLMSVRGSSGKSNIGKVITRARFCSYITYVRPEHRIF